ncbi:Acetophenone carboxylase gamma subunit [Achromobacter veterisilvae]|uniref:Acetophenone carboxylase gamma subunit n=1 Tax=Achromobacter veterisilvae TaxID=2069367 RepID=A0A446C3D0_9BURK|nr:hydantoinase/oxoprolinase family protein [Achromobacter veterisilvae]SSW62345.1 Acetophenone carboxylase gamma subunit [Achromobacter veterisilvae]
MTISSTPDAAVRVAVDVGGTFTDIVLERERRRWSAKLLTTPDTPETAVLQGIQELLDQAGLGWPQIGLLILGTTLATNALIERKGARTALLTTAGFRDLVEIGLEDRFAQYDIFLDKPEPLVPRPWRHGITERVDAQGRVLTPLDEAQVIALARELTEAGIESVAVCLLHSYAHPDHERRIRELLREHAPQLWISLSSDVCAEIREYPRLSTVSANAYVQPQVSGYLRRFNDAARERGLREEPFLMTSGGAIATLQTGVEEPVRLVESGPAGGAILAQHIAQQTGAARALSFDMGGTTAKICYIDDYEPQVSRSFEFGRVHRHLKGSGLPIRIPVIEMVEIGAGGGSIARINQLGSIQVGPDSAGSSPGPAAYGNGGELPTVTDAHALLGTVTPERFAVGKVGLRPELAWNAIQTHLAAPAGLEAPQAAQAIVEVVSENMANAARVHASELGKSADEHVLIAFGGAAPLHAAGLARKLGIARVIIPESAGVGSAVGFLWAPIAYQAVRSFHQRLAGIDHAAVQALLDDLTAGVDAVVRRAAPDAALSHKRVVFMRYSGQGHEIAVDLPEGPFDASASARLGEAFAQRYAQLYGRNLPHVAAEAVSWSVAAQAGERRVPEADRIASGPAIAARQAGTRRLYDFERDNWTEVPCYERAALDAEQKLTGPALVVEDETTTFVPAGFEARRSRLGSLVLDDVGAAAARQALSTDKEIAS